jgi:hypothetical protein
MTYLSNDKYMTNMPRKFRLEDITERDHFDES